MLRGATTAAAGLSVGAASAPAARAADSVDVPDVTATLVGYLVEARYEDLPGPVRKEGCRSLLNWVGCAVGGSRHETVEAAVAALDPLSGPREATLLGRSGKMDVSHAAFVNGVASHIFDYDDTHLKTIIHPAGPVASALLALSQRRPVDGRAFLNALVLGMETECRIGNAVYPEHYSMGWHITGSTGTFGAAAACAKLMGLDAQKTTWALGIAASQPVGLKIQFGTSTKSFHPGRAAQNGLLAALLAEQGFTAADQALEGRDGWGQALSTRHDWREVTEGLGTRYEAALNTYKPFACGIVTHPAIDAAIQLRNENRLTGAEVQEAVLRANPLVLSLTGKTDPATGLEGKFSIYHCIAMGLLQGAAGERQFSDAAVRDPAAVALRRKVRVETDPAIASEQCELILRLADGRVLSKKIEHAVGSLERPMSDAALEAKFADLARDILPAAQTRRLMDLCWGVEALPSAAAVAEAAQA